MSISKHLQDKLALLPDSPGCYIMKDEHQNILYVGKAKVLKNRVRSYFHGTHNNKTTRLVSHIRAFEFIVTGSEKEALLLEINLIKKHMPPYNIMFMDDKTYPYIEITKENNFVVRTTRNIKSKKSEYFGPYPSSQSAYEIVRLINQIFCVRKCRHIPDAPCLYYHMHQCLGPCIHEIDPKENEKTRKKIKKFLQGDTKEVMDSLQARMLEASENLQFEKAQEIYKSLSYDFAVAYDDAGSIGKRYRRMDEVGTPYCITVDDQTLEDGTVTIRNRDTMEQERLSVEEVRSKILGEIRF